VRPDFIVELLNEKTFRDLGSGFVVVKKNNKFREKLFKKTD